MSDDVPRHLLVDAGPVVGMIDVHDEYHEISTHGIRSLHAGRTRLMIPLPIVFEVYKRVAYDVNARAARRVLGLMLDGFEVIFIANEDLTALRRLMASMPWWEGSLEDATLAMIGLRRKVPVWTFNYRDLKSFSNLQFWNPA